MTSPLLDGRESILASLRAELLGPAPTGEAIELTGALVFDNAELAVRPRVEAGTGQEILNRDNPIRRYGLGVLYPMGAAQAIGDDPPSDVELHDATLGEAQLLSEQAVKSLAQIQDRSPEPTTTVEGEDDEELDLTEANTYRPSSMAISFLISGSEGHLAIGFHGATYTPIDVTVSGKPRRWWVRRPLIAEFEISLADLRTGQSVRRLVAHAACDRLQLSLEVYARPRLTDGSRILTLCAVNRTPFPDRADEFSVFQSELKAIVRSENGVPLILPYPRSAKAKDDEEQGLSLLYRKVETFAVGHGCAADWDDPRGSDRVGIVYGRPLPTFEVPSITPDLREKNRGLLTVGMARLAGLEMGSDGTADLEELVTRYETWIGEQRAEVARLASQYQEPAKRHIAACDTAAGRMRSGLEYLRTSMDARLAFQLANHAMLLQQLAGAAPKRHAMLNSSGRIEFNRPFTPPSAREASPEQGRWRPFQIAFLLMALRSAAEGAAPDRDTVELIWFPTGGGKTEAYLALAAFSMIMRRLRKPSDAGTTVLMRYTLRLLTAQQFQRACRLICAVESLRRERKQALGETPFSIGIWVGGSTTPNSRTEARKSFRDISAKWEAPNRFLVAECPWCKAPVGRIEISAEANGSKRGKGKRRAGKPLVLGLVERGQSVVFECPDRICTFAKGIPIHVVDEDIYQERPTFVLGTVDKFAMLAWRPEARSLFGLNERGEHHASPPGLIIQDELHLISGPLGSLVGLYEAVIEELCTDRREASAVKPKLVCSTATIRRFREQVRALYGRTETSLFPPPGLDAADSFFAQYARDSSTGDLLPGRRYVGVHGPGLGSLQTAQVRTLAALLQAPMRMDISGRDPWWTLLVFFNSLRELGSTLSLVQSDIPDYLRAIKGRLGIDWKDVRRLTAVEELTSRLKDDEVSQAIAKLEAQVGSDYTADLCLASSIIEVGVDIDRLSVMAVVGQPKTTAQYIQVTGRVGRKWQERPGLVAVIYSASKARDKSHFEHFRSYHERLYAQVEPTSVTPFSLPVLERALHAAVAVYVRQMGPVSAAESPYPVPKGLLERFRQLLESRSLAAEENERAEESRQQLLAVLARRMRQWEAWQPRSWTSRDGGDVPLLRRPGEYVNEVDKAKSWATPMSMRNVDAECQLVISALLTTSD